VDKEFKRILADSGFAVGKDGVPYTPGTEPFQSSLPDDAGLAEKPVEGQTSTATTVVQPVLPVKPAKVDATLTRILSWKRPHGSAGEINFVEWLKGEIGRRGAEATELKHGHNLCVVVKPKGKDAKAVPIIFSCHTDTVHHECSGDQGLIYDPTMGHIALDKNHPTKGSCLGADDGAGIWLCLEMIKNKVPGTYLFHRGEEKGGIGSNALLDGEKEWLKQFMIALAFDRKDTVDVVITQGGSPCASSAFGHALAKALNDADSDFAYKISHGGTFTDTKVYRGVIRECANISVGYENAHGSDEYLNYEHLLKLRDALCLLKWMELPVVREAKTWENTYAGKGSNNFDYKQGRVWNAGLGKYIDPPTTTSTQAGLYDEAEAHFARQGKGKARTEFDLVKVARSAGEPQILDELRNMSKEDIQEVADDSDAAFSVIIALYAELDGAYRKIDTYRSLAELD
jgi:hypothetical protein